MPWPKLLPALLLAFSFGHVCAQTYILHGKIKGVDDGWAFVRHRQTGKTDPGQIAQGRFTVSGPITDPEFCNFGYSGGRTKDYYLGFFLQRGTFTIKADTAALNDIGIVFTGSPVEKAFQQFQRQVAYINRHYYPESINPRLGRLTASYALKHPGSYISAFALDSYENDPAKLSRLYKRLSPKIQQSYYGRLIQGKLAQH